MRKMKSFVIICMLGLFMVSRSQNFIVELMEIVDNYGEKTGACVVEEIDFLNDCWYFVEWLNSPIE